MRCPYSERGATAHALGQYSVGVLVQHPPSTYSGGAGGLPPKPVVPQVAPHCPQGPPGAGPWGLGGGCCGPVPSPGPGGLAPWPGGHWVGSLAGVHSKASAPCNMGPKLAKCASPSGAPATAQCHTQTEPD